MMERLTDESGEGEVMKDIKEKSSEGKVILFDIDKTLIDRDVFWVNLNEEISKIEGADESTLDDVYSEYKKELESPTDFDADRFIRRLASKIESKSVKEMNDIFYNPELWKDSVYPEARETIKKLKEMGYYVGVFSDADVSYQFGKLRMTGLDKELDPDLIFITKGKTEDAYVERLPDNVIIVDDKREVVEKLATKGRFNPYWINRSGNSEKTEDEKVKTISNLMELITLLPRKAKKEIREKPKEEIPLRVSEEVPVAI
jgi:FMN phosphatase YigB (HAD superfamily)